MNTDRRGTGEALRVDLATLRRVATALANLPIADDAPAVMATALDAQMAAVMTGAAPSASAAAAADVVEATKAELREVAAATAAFSGGLRAAAARYAAADDRAGARLGPDG